MYLYQSNVGTKLCKYRNVASSNTSLLEAHAGFFRLLMKGIFVVYVLWPFDKKLITWLVTRVRTRNYTVLITYFQVIFKMKRLPPNRVEKEILKWKQGYPPNVTGFSLIAERGERELR